MKIELAQTRFDEGVGVFDVGCVLRDTEGNPEIKIVKFSGFTEIDENGRHGTRDNQRAFFRRFHNGL